MTREERALECVELIYGGAVDPPVWNLLVERLSVVFGGAAAALSVQLPESAPPLEYYTIGFREECREVAEKYFAEGRLPWGSFLDDQFKGRFAFASEKFPDEQLPDTDFYRDVMKPQELAPESPMIHLICNEPGRPLSGLAIYRREGGRCLGEEDLRLGNLLVPHLARAFEIHNRVGEIQRGREALTEVVDRLPLGVILIDSRHQPVITNRAARQILAREDGFRIDRCGPHAANAREDTVLRQMVADAVAVGAGQGSGPAKVLSISRPSGERAHPVMVAPLLEPPTGGTDRDAVAALFIADTDDSDISMTEVLQGLYSLTRAEAELVGLLVQGLSLEEAAQQRGVTMNTVRSQLKQVFSKTDTKRQGQLVRLVLSSVAPIQDE
jgi:DNA-binding CsgD family transcriptional regulator/PAS domain-containing protein